MRVLVINNGKFQDKVYERILTDFLDIESIVYETDTEDGADFITKELIGNGKHIDLIICNYDYGFSRRTGRDFLIWLRSINNLYYSDEALKINNIPVVIIHALAEDDYLIGTGFDGALSYQDIEMNRNAVGVLLSAIGTWFDRLLGDYDHIGLNPCINNSFYDLRFTHIVNISAIHTCSILSPVYNRRPFRLPFLSFQEDIERIEKYIEGFQKEIRRISKLPTKRQEAEYHEALKRNKFILLGNSYDYYWHETPFHYPGSKESVRPDFIRRPYFYSHTGVLDIFEVKLPKEKLLKGTDFHTPLSSKLYHSLAQVKDYQKYFKRSDTVNEISSRLLTKPHDTSYTLLIGKDGDKEHFHDILNTRLVDFGSADIVVMTYDDLLRRREKMINYRKLYRVYDN